ncbi:MAG: hypothetical protein CM15mP47_4970 [Methanobacteriota archaeon]|nr:MAG: hypothetical protein CM15mP47_4970 [Euryarchaeota archaeon]
MQKIPGAQNLNFWENFSFAQFLFYIIIASKIKSFKTPSESVETKQIFRLNQTSRDSYVLRSRKPFLFQSSDGPPFRANVRHWEHCAGYTMVSPLGVLKGFFMFFCVKREPLVEGRMNLRPRVFARGLPNPLSSPARQVASPHNSDGKKLIFD